MHRGLSVRESEGDVFYLFCDCHSYQIINIKQLYTCDSMDTRQFNKFYQHLNMVYFLFFILEKKAKLCVCRERG